MKRFRGWAGKCYELRLMLPQRLMVEVENVTESDKVTNLVASQRIFKVQIVGI